MTVLKMKVGTDWIPVGGTPETVWTGPSAPTDPNIDLWIDTDEPAFIPNPYTPLDQSTWAWVNQGGATVTQAGGIVYLNAPAGAGDSVRLRIGTLPATPFTLTARVEYDLADNALSDGSLVLRESGTGKLELLRVRTDSASLNPHCLFVTTASSPTALVANVFTRPVTGFAPRWLRLAYDGTTITYSYSVDGLNFRALGSRAKTTYFTVGPDQIGVGVNVNSATYPAAVSVLSWVIT